MSVHVSGEFIDYCTEKGISVHVSDEHHCSAFQYLILNIDIDMLGAPTWQFEERAVYDVIDADHLL